MMGNHQLLSFHQSTSVASYCRNGKSEKGKKRKWTSGQSQPQSTTVNGYEPSPPPWNCKANVLMDWIWDDKSMSPKEGEQKGAEEKKQREDEDSHIQRCRWSAFFATNKSLHHPTSEQLPGIYLHLSPWLPECSTPWHAAEGGRMKPVQSTYATNLRSSSAWEQFWIMGSMMIHDDHGKKSMTYGIYPATIEFTKRPPLQHLTNRGEGKI